MQRFVLLLDGTLTNSTLQRVFAEIQPALDASVDKVAILVNCLNMSNYELAARSSFVTWNARNRAKIDRVAVVTTKTVWHVVVSAMALASGQKMRAFHTLTQAEQWLE